MEEEKRVAVLAGTRVDTKMGVDFLLKKNEEERRSGSSDVTVLPQFRPVSVTCDEQLAFQYSDQDNKRRVIDSIFSDEIEKGTRDFFIYCNSLSGAFDFDSYAAEMSEETGLDIRVYTPLQVYRRLAVQYGRLGVMAANNLSAHAIEEVLVSKNPSIYVIGSGNMPVVRAIEDGVSPETIVKELALGSLAAYMKACGAEALILGCTHFPYFKDELAAVTDLPVIDPADEMYRSVTDR